MDAAAASTSSTSLEPRIDELVLDAGPLVTQQRLTGLAKRFYIPPSVVAELRDQRARDHLAWLQSEAGGSCTVEVREGGAEARAAVVAFARKTGDYAVLSSPDLSVLALTYALEVQRHGHWRIRDEVNGKTGQQKRSAEEAAEKRAKAVAAGESESKAKTEQAKDADTGITVATSSIKDVADLTKQMAITAVATPETETDAKEEALPNEHAQAKEVAQSEESAHPREDAQAGEDVQKPVSDEGIETDSNSEDDEETGGEWITPDNIDNHKSRALGLVTESDLSLLQTSAKSKSNGRMRSTVTHANGDGWSTVVSKNTVQPARTRAQQQQSKKAATTSRLTVACMTGDYAVQNVLLQMGMSLVGLEGQRIRQVKSWVLRCHACFKICKDAERKFCPQCGNATLLRTSVTSTDPQAVGKNGVGGIEVHLKRNFQYKNRGTKYPLPLPKAGKASGAPASVPILREDQAEWQKALHSERIQRGKEERALQRALARGSDSLSARYEDADELSILLAGKTHNGQQHGLPALGIGRKNPNEKRRRKV